MVTIREVWGPVVIFDERMYHGTGTVARWMDLVTFKFEAFAKTYAPVHTGAMKAAINAEVRTVGPRQMEGIIASPMPYTMYVLRGTTGPIMSNRAWNTLAARPGLELSQIVRGKDGTGAPRRGMMLRFEGYDGRLHLAASVSGQDANNFMFRAWRAVGRNHKALRGISIPSIVNP